MSYEQFLKQMKEDLTERFTKDLPPELADVRIGIRDVEKQQGESYRGLSFRSGNSPVEIDLNMMDAFKAYEAGHPYEEIVEEVQAQIMGEKDHASKLDIGELCNYEAMKPKLMLELIPQKGNEDRLENIPHQKIEDLALVYRLDMGDRAGNKITSVITNRQLETFGISAEQLHQDALMNAPVFRPASLRPIYEVLAAMMEKVPEEISPDEPMMLVATTQDAFMGASVIQYPGFLEQASEPSREVALQCPGYCCDLQGRRRQHQYGALGTGEKRVSYPQSETAGKRAHGGDRIRDIRNAGRGAAGYSFTGYRITGYGKSGYGSFGYGNPLGNK